MGARGGRGEGAGGHGRHIGRFDFDSWLRTDTVRYRLICTEKDAVKLWKTHPDALAVPLQFSPEPAFFTAVDQLLDAALSSPDPISRRP